MVWPTGVIARVSTATLPRWDAQLSLYNAQQLLIEARLEQLTSEVNLYNALGGGWHDSHRQARRSVHCSRRTSLTRK